MRWSCAFLTIKSTIQHTFQLFLYADCIVNIFFSQSLTISSLWFQSCESKILCTYKSRHLMKMCVCVCFKEKITKVRKRDTRTDRRSEGRLFHSKMLTKRFRGDRTTKNWRQTKSVKCLAARWCYMQMLFEEVALPAAAQPAFYCGCCDSLNFK